MQFFGLAFLLYFKKRPPPLNFPKSPHCICYAPDSYSYSHSYLYPLNFMTHGRMVLYFRCVILMLTKKISLLLPVPPKLYDTWKNGPVLSLCYFDVFGWPTKCLEGFTIFIFFRCHHGGVEPEKVVNLIISDYLVTGEIPENWQTEKKRKYQPISLISIVCKRKEIYIKQDLLSKIQHGFISGRSNVKVKICI